MDVVLWDSNLPFHIHQVQIGSLNPNLLWIYQRKRSLHEDNVQGE